MITLTAEIQINRPNPVPFIIGKSKIGGNDLIGKNINVKKDFDRRNLISIERAIFDRSDLKMPSWGIISNVGNLEFVDSNKRFLGYANAGILVEGMKIELFLNNTLVNGATEKVGTFYTDQWNYENDSKVVSVSLKDDLEEWQDINVKGLDLQTIKSAMTLYMQIYNQTPKKYNLISFSDLDNHTKEILQYTYIQYPFFENGSLWQQWTKLCQVCQLHIYKNNDGIVICRYNGGN